MISFRAEDPSFLCYQVGEVVPHADHIGGNALPRCGILRKSHHLALVVEYTRISRRAKSLDRVEPVYGTEERRQVLVLSPVVIVHVKHREPFTDLLKLPRLLIQPRRIRMPEVPAYIRIKIIGKLDECFILLRSINFHLVTPSPGILLDFVDIVALFRVFV